MNAETELERHKQRYAMLSDTIRSQSNRVAQLEERYRELRQILEDEQRQNAERVDVEQQQAIGQVAQRKTHLNGMIDVIGNALGEYARGLASLGSASPRDTKQLKHMLKRGSRGLQNPRDFYAYHVPQQQQQQQAHLFTNHDSQFVTLFVQHREQDLLRLQASIAEVTRLMTHVSDMVLEQGVMIQGIEANLEQAERNVQRGNTQLARNLDYSCQPHHYVCLGTASLFACFVFVF